MVASTGESRHSRRSFVGSWEREESAKRSAAILSLSVVAVAQLVEPLVVVQVVVGSSPISHLRQSPREVGLCPASLPFARNQ